MPVEETENEIRVRIRDQDEFTRLVQIFPNDKTLETYPYNKMGIRGMGGPLKDGGDTKIQGYQFSKDDRYDWTPDKAEKWVRDQDETPKGYSEPLGPVDFTFDFPISVVKSMSEVPDGDRVKVPDGVEVVYIEGPLSTDEIDRQDDVIDQASITFKDFLKNPVLLFQHKPEWPIGKVLKITKNKDLGDGRRGLWIRAAIIGDTEKAREILKLVKNRIVRGFSIRGKAQGKKRVCLSKNVCHNVLLNLNVVEATVTPVPANQGTLFSVAKSLIDLHSPAGQNEHSAGDDTEQEEANMSNTDEKKQELQMPPELLERLEALDKNVTAIAERMTKVETEITALKKPEEEEAPADEQTEETAAADDGKGAAKTDDKKTEPTVVEVNGVKKSLNTSARGSAGATGAGIEVEKASQDAKQLAEAIWMGAHPK